MPQHEPVVPHEQDEWLEDLQELPPRPRRRLLGAGGNPIFLALLGVLLIACGFIGGVLVEKGQTSSGSAAGGTTGLASRFAALRGGTSSAGARSGAAGGAGAFLGSGSGSGKPTSGTLAYLAGNTLYVTNAEGNTVKVKTSAGTNVTKNVKASVTGIHYIPTGGVCGSKEGTNGTYSGSIQGELVGGTVEWT